MCEQCLTNPLSFGEPLPGWFLMRARRDGNDWMKGEWGLIQVNDPTFRWKLTPTPSPLWGMTDEEEEAWFEATAKGTPEYYRGFDLLFAEEFEEFAETFEKCGPITGYEIVSAAIEKGYKPKESGDFAFWLFDYLGEFLKTVEMMEEGDPFPNREEFAPTDYSIGRD